MQKIVSCPYCDKAIMFETDINAEWQEKKYLCPFCTTQFIIFADRQMGLFFTDRIFKTDAGRIPCIRPKNDAQKRLEKNLKKMDSYKRLNKRLEKIGVSPYYSKEGNEQRCGECDQTRDHCSCWIFNLARTP